MADPDLRDALLLMKAPPALREEVRQALIDLERLENGDLTTSDATEIAVSVMGTMLAVLRAKAQPTTNKEAEASQPNGEGE